MLVSMTQMNLSTKQKQTNREGFIPKCHFSGDTPRISELPSQAVLQAVQWWNLASPWKN